MSIKMHSFDLFGAKNSENSPIIYPMVKFF